MPEITRATIAVHQIAMQKQDQCHGHAMTGHSAKAPKPAKWKTVARIVQRPTRPMPVLPEFVLFVDM